MQLKISPKKLRGRPGILATRNGKKTTLDMISEPEAAALAFFNDPNLSGQINLKADLTCSMIVCLFKS